MKTKQETFDTVVNALRAQGGPSLLEVGGCAYRSEGGRNCAASVLIPDSEYGPQFEGLSVNCEEVGSVLTRAGHDMNFVRELQTIHDKHSKLPDEEWLAEFEREASDLACRQGLTYPEPEYVG